MYKNLLLALAIVVLLSGGLHAQSSSKKGSSSKTSSASMQRKKDRMMAADIDKAAKKIAREEFLGIKLDKAQRDTLQSLTKANFGQLTSLDTQIGQMIPKDKIKKLQRVYKKSKREGAAEKDAMMTSMVEIKLPEMTQEKVMKLNNSKAEIVGKIADGVKELFSEEQKTMLAEKIEMKKDGMKKDAMEQGVKKAEPMGSSKK